MIALSLTRSAGLLQGLEFTAYDNFLRWRQSERAAAPQIVIIGITENDLQRLGHYPVYDSEMAAAIQKIADDDASVIGIDIYRDINTPPGRDELNDALLQHKNTIAVSRFHDGTLAVGPPPVLRETDRYGVSNVMTDTGVDDSVRRGLLFLDDGENVYYSFSLRVALEHLKAQGVAPQPGDDIPEHLRIGPTTFTPFSGSDGEYVGADDRGYQFLLDYRGPSEFTHYSFTDLLRGAVPPGELEGKIVLIGTRASTSINDYVITPVRSYVYGVEFHAIAIDQILRAATRGDPPIRTLTDGLEHLITVILCALGAWVSYKIRSPLYFVIALLVGVSTYTGIAYTAFTQNLWSPIVTPALGWLITATLVTSY
ncbi:MAG: CHASE2 domain-containing protein, partial [Planctomycetota bacterium]